MKALSFDGSLRFTTMAPRPERHGEALVQVLYAGICNTDLEIVKGYGAFRGIPGHEFVGRIVEAPDNASIGRRVVGEINVGCDTCKECRAGDPRHCAGRTVLGIKGRDGAFAEFLSLPLKNLIEVPVSITDLQAVFVEPLAAACQILEQVSIDGSSNVCVVGDGKLAQLIIRVLASRGCAPTVIGKHDEKLELALSAGARRAMKPGGRPPSGTADLEPGPPAGDKFDVVVEASGSRSGLPLALELVRPRGIVILKSTHHDKASVDLSRVVVGEITIMGSRCGRFRPALDLLAAGSISVEPLLYEVLPVEEGLGAFRRAAEPSSLKVVLRVAAEPIP